MPIRRTGLREVAEHRLARNRLEAAGMASAARTAAGEAGAASAAEDMRAVAEASAERASARQRRRCAHDAGASCDVTNACSICPTGGRARRRSSGDPPPPAPRSPYAAASSPSFPDASALPCRPCHSAPPASRSECLRCQIRPLPAAAVAALLVSSVASCRQKRWWQCAPKTASPLCEAREQHQADPQLLVPLSHAAFRLRVPLVSSAAAMSSAASRVLRATRPVQKERPKLRPIAEEVDLGSEHQWRTRQIEERSLAVWLRPKTWNSSRGEAAGLRLPQV